MKKKIIDTIFKWLYLICEVTILIILIVAVIILATILALTMFPICYLYDRKDTLDAIEENVKRHKSANKLDWPKMIGNFIFEFSVQRLKNLWHHIQDISTFNR